MGHFECAVYRRITGVSQATKMCCTYSPMDVKYAFLKGYDARQKGGCSFSRWTRQDSRISISISILTSTPATPSAVRQQTFDNRYILQSFCRFPPVGRNPLRTGLAVEQARRDTHSLLTKAAFTEKFQTPGMRAGWVCSPNQREFVLSLRVRLHFFLLVLSFCP